MCGAMGRIKYTTVDESVVKPKVEGAGFFSVELEPQVADCWPIKIVDAVFI